MISLIFMKDKNRTSEMDNYFRVESDYFYRFAYFAKKTKRTNYDETASIENDKRCPFNIDMKFDEIVRCSIYNPISYGLS